MKKGIVLIILGVFLASIMSVCLAQAVNPIAPAPGNTSNAKVEYYATFLTVATFQGIAYDESNGRPLVYPGNKHGNIATFNIDKTLVYAKYNLDGDNKSNVFTILMDNGLSTSPYISRELYDKIKSYKPGQKVLLSWDHLYITETNGTKHPERPVTLMQYLSDNQANLITEVSGPKYGFLDRYYVSSAKYTGMVKGNYIFEVISHDYAYYYDNISTKEFVSTFSVSKKANKNIINQIKKLKVNDMVLMSVRRDIVKNKLVFTPLFVLPRYL